MTFPEYINKNTTSIFEDINRVPSSNFVNNKVTLLKYLTSEADNVILRRGYLRKTAGKVNFKNFRFDSSELLEIVSCRIFFLRSSKMEMMTCLLASQNNINYIGFLYRVYMHLKDKFLIWLNYNCYERKKERKKEREKENKRELFTIKKENIRKRKKNRKKKESVAHQSKQGRKNKIIKHTLHQRVGKKSLRN